MAIVSVSLDTATRQAVLTINGILVPSDEFNISKYIKYDTKDEFGIDFGYSVENVDGNGMKERRHYYLPSANSVAELNEDGFASKIARNDEKAKADTIDFLKRKRNH
jgi:hypothetical protein